MPIKHHEEVNLRPRPRIAPEINRGQPPTTSTMMTTEDVIFPGQTRKSPTTGTISQ